MGCIIKAYSSRKRTKPTSLLVGLGIISIVFGTAVFKSFNNKITEDFQQDFDFNDYQEQQYFGRSLLSFGDHSAERRPRQIGNPPNETTSPFPSQEYSNSTTNAPKDNKPKGEYPHDIFDVEARRKGL